MSYTNNPYEETNQNTLTDAWGEEVPDPIARAYVTTTGVHLPLGVATRVGNVVVTTTMQAPGMAVANVEGPYNSVTHPKLSKLLGDVEQHEVRRRNWVKGRGWFTGWLLRGGVALDENGKVVTPS